MFLFFFTFTWESWTSESVCDEILNHWKIVWLGRRNQSWCISAPNKNEITEFTLLRALFWLCCWLLSFYLPKFQVKHCAHWCIDIAIWLSYRTKSVRFGVEEWARERERKWRRKINSWHFVCISTIFSNHHAMSELRSHTTLSILCVCVCALLLSWCWRLPLLLFCFCCCWLGSGDPEHT